MTHRLLLDVSSLMYRAHFALPDSVRAPDGRPIGALHGYLDMVTRLVVERRPDDVMHVFDHDWRPVARTAIYPGYKANRPPEPDGLGNQFQLLRELLTVIGMPQAQTPDWEAEDAIGALVARASAEDHIDMVSGDRDLLQLVRDAPPAVRLLFTVRGVSELHAYDEAAVIDKYGVPAERYAEFAILRGDPSDELPGVHGVGAKTARELVRAYRDLDELLAEAAAGSLRPGPLKGAPKLRARLREAAGYVDAMRRIVPVNADAPLSLHPGTRDAAEARRMAEAHGLRGPVQRLLAAIDSTLG